MTISSKLSSTKPSVLSTQLEHTSLTALVVDDNIVDRRVHTKFLRKNNFEVLQANSGMEAIELHLSGEKFDLILIDDRMPSMDGDETVRILRLLGVETVIFGMGFEEHREALMNAGADEFVLKPWLRMEYLLREYNLV